MIDGVEVADAVQDYLMARYWTVWPVCSRHALSFHAVHKNSAPVWECSAGRHHVAIIGDDRVDPDSA